MNIKITADSTCDISKEIAQKYGFELMPLSVALGENDYLDGVTITPDDIYKYYEETKNLPKSGARSAYDYEEFFRQRASEDCAVIHFNISNQMSVSHNNAVMASKEVPNVYVIDSKNLSTGTALLMLYAWDLVQQGCTPQEVVDKVNQRAPYVQASFVVDSLEFLHKGGRCSATSKIFANMLGIKPVIEVKNGAMGVAKKHMGTYKHCIKRYVKETLQNYNNPDKKRIFITHTKMDPEILSLVMDLVKSYGIFEEVLETTAGCTITTHCGEGTLGILYINDGQH
ncbi:MAG: DegV family protein [Clostridia bacterium]|nr:DegV family protein [Clostridia bacterium]